MKPMAVYIHIPFCTVKCGYCDFNAYAGLDSLKAGYTAALVAEIRAWATHLGPRQITSVFLGGGTPGEMATEDIAAIIDAARGLGTLPKDCEVTLEANPATLLEGQMERLRTAGVTRLSLGAQSFHAEELQFLDRIHSPQAIAACLRAARTAGFDSVSLDLIYGLPGQTVARFMESLGRGVETAPDHLSLYALTVEPGTMLAARVAAHELQPADPDLVAEMYEAASERLAAAGFDQYELSNWARPGHPSRHNLAYWTDAEYVGIGAGAHGYIGGERYENIAHPREYIRATAMTTAAGGGQLPVLHSYRPNLSMRLLDWLETGLRRIEGFAFADFEAAFGFAFPAALTAALQPMAAGALVQMETARLALGKSGRLLQNEIVATLLPLIEREFGPMLELAATWAPLTSAIGRD